MKKISLLLVVSLLTMLTSAQELTSKKGTPILPTAGDWALSVDATPFLDFAGNLIGANGTNVAPTMNFLSGNRTIIGKYFVTDTKAFRLGARLGINSTTTKNELTDLPNYTEDKATASSFDLGLTAGVEFRRGISRLQGYYGGEVGLALGSGATSFTYGDPAAPTSTLQKSKNGFMFGLGAPEMLLIIGGALLLFGGKKIPELLNISVKRFVPFTVALNLLLVHKLCTKSRAPSSLYNLFIVKVLEQISIFS